MPHTINHHIFEKKNDLTAILIANKIIIDNGMGVIVIPLDRYRTFLDKLSNDEEK